MAGVVEDTPSAFYFERKIMLKSIKIKSLCCRVCSQRLIDALAKIAGVRSADVNLEKGRAEVYCSNSVKNRKIRREITSLGFSAGRVKTKRVDYRALLLKGSF